MERPKSVNLVEKYAKYPLLVMHLMGLWRKDSNPTLYKIYAAFVLGVTQYFYTLFQIIYLVTVWNDIEKFAEASFFLLTQVTLCIKITIFIIKKEKATYLINAMNCDRFAPCRDSHYPVINATSKVQVVEFWIFLYLSSQSIALWTTFPLVDAAPGEKLLPFKAWYPFPADQSPCYELLYFYQIIVMWFSALINVSIDRLSTGMTAFGCAQLELLKDNLINIEIYAQDDMNEFEKNLVNENNNPSVEEKVAVGKEINLYEETDFSQRKSYLEEMIQTSLVNSILHHRSVVLFIFEVEDIFHWGILTQIAASVGIICITGLQLTLTSPTSIKFFTKVTYMMVILAQIFFLCRIGNDISIISGELTEAAYKSPWIERSKRFHTTLIIFMERLKQPIVTRAGYFFPLSLQTFVSILRSSYSYFAVLQQINDD